MKTNKFGAATTIVGCLLLGVGFVFAADRAASAGDLEKVQEQVRTLDKDLAVLKETSTIRLDAQDKRLSDVGLATAHQANHLSAISNQTATVGNYIAITSALITLFVLGAGFITYFSAKSRAEKEAREASTKWFDENATKLLLEIENLRAKTKTASGEIDIHKQQVADRSKAVLDHVRTRQEEVDVAAANILQTKGAARDGLTVGLDPAAVAVIERASNELKSIPETQFKPEDHYARGLALYSAGNFQGALTSFQAASAALPARSTAHQQANYLFAQGVTLGALGKSKEEIAVYDEIDRRFGKDEAPAVREQVVKGLVGKGVTLGTLGKSEEAIAVYDEIDRRFGKDEAPAVREQVARARNSAAFTRILSAKKIWTDGQLRTALLDNAIASLERIAENCADDMRAMVFGNLGYASYLRGNKIAAVESTKKCLQLGGEELLAGQRADAKLHRVEPEDTDYEKLLEQLWIELHPAKT